MNIFCIFSSKKIMKICSKTHQIALLKKISPIKRLAKPRVASSFAACNSPSPQKVGPTLSNHTYSHGLLLRNLFVEMRS